MGERYASVVEGPDGWSEWQRAKNWKERIACCDCSLTHDFEFQVQTDGRLYYRVRSNMRATAQLRRKKRR